MKIATWNIERPIKTSKKIPLIIDCLQKLDADILILTETNEVIQPAVNYNCFYTSTLKELFYKEGERRTSIYSKYEAVGQFDTFRDDTSICITLRTPLGDLAVYGTVIGINGNRRHNFNEGLTLQLADFERISANTNFCLAGDLNMSFGDNYYFTQDGRQKLNASFEKLNLKNLTASIPDNIDHIIISNDFIKDRIIKLATWNVDKKLSDHIGVCVTIS